MSKEIEGTDASLWVATTEKTNYPKLADDDTVYDVAVVGGGITGVVSAYLLQQKGLKVVVVEKNNIVEWTTGGTTAKLSSQHYLIYDYLIRRHGEDAARAYAEANQNGIDDIERFSNELGIDSEFTRKSAYVFSTDDTRTEAIRAEVEAAKKIGLPASFETSVDLPFDVTAAVKFADQAQFHPRKFLLPLAERFVKNGGVIYEQTEATDITPGTPNTLETKLGTIRAKSIIQASGSPFWNGDIFDGYMWEKASYALAVTLKSGDYPNDMYITTDKPMRTLRSATYDGKPVMIFGGESHEYNDETFEDDMQLHYQNLVDDVHTRFDVDKILYRWLASDQMPYDRMPYFGAMPDQSSIYAITGYRAWGLAWAMSAARAIVGDMTNEPLAWAEHFSLDRLKQPLRDEDKQTGF